MAVTILLTAVIIIYCLWVIRKKYKDAKNGKFCSCGCEDCPSKCHEFKKRG